MENDLISRTTIIKNLGFGKTLLPIDTTLFLISFIKQEPTVDAALVVHGRWILSGDDDEFMNCSVCGIQRYSEDKDFKCDITSYCPHCGARMDLEENNEN